MKRLADPDVYSDEVLERFEDLPGAGWFDAPDYSGCASSSARNATICLALRVQAGRVEEARFRARGCPHAIALASKACEVLEGQEIAGLAEFDATALVEALPVPASKLDLKILIEDAVRAASQK